MIRVALLDDEPGQRELTAALLRRYLSQHPELTVQIRSFQSGYELLDAAERGGFDLYLLDIVMPEQNGIEVGLAVRRLDSVGLIVYLTTSPDYAVDSYLTNAFHYLLKPVRWEQMSAMLDRAMEILTQRHCLSVMVRAKGTSRRVLHSELQYAELCGRCVHYQLAGGEKLEGVSLQKSFRDEVADFLSDPAFLLCGASYIINLAFVTQVDKGFLYMKDGARIPLPRKNAAQIRAAWVDFWLGGGTS